MVAGEKKGQCIFWGKYKDCNRWYLLLPTALMWEWYLGLYVILQESSVR